MRHFQHDHRPRGRGGRLRGAVRARRRRQYHYRNVLLVLWLRDHGHESPLAQGRLGLQRHRTPGCGLSGRRPGRPRPEGPAGLRHLRPRCPGPQRQHHPRRRGREDPPLRPRRPGHGHHARQELSFHGQHLHGHRRFHRGCGLPPEISGHAGRVRIARRNPAPRGLWHLRPRGVPESHGVGREILQTAGRP